MTAPASEAARRLAEAERVLVITGAGISAESGIPTFRGPGGLWEGYRAEELATPEAFARDPELVWRWYGWRRGVCRDAEPNPGHGAIAALERDVPHFLLATQNVDGLHRRAGSEQLVELHGCIELCRCTGCEEIRELEPDFDGASPPRCGSCGALERPHIVWFGESYWPGVLERALAFAARADVCLVVGTSGMVWPPVAVALQAQQSGAWLVDVNPNPSQVSAAADAWLQGPSGELLPDVIDEARRLRGA